MVDTSERTTTEKKDCRRRRKSVQQRLGKNIKGDEVSESDYEVCFVFPIVIVVLILGFVCECSFSV